MSCLKLGALFLGATVLVAAALYSTGFGDDPVIGACPDLFFIDTNGDGVFDTPGGFSEYPTTSPGGVSTFTIDTQQLLNVPCCREVIFTIFGPIYGPVTAPYDFDAGTCPAGFAVDPFSPANGCLQLVDIQGTLTAFLPGGAVRNCEIDGGGRSSFFLTFVGN